MKVYIVIPQYIRKPELIELATNAINSFRKTSDVTIISVDDGGIPEMAEQVQALADIPIKNPKNLGFAPTCNNGFQWIFDNEPEDCWIVCANNDIEVYDGWLKSMTEPFDMFENVGITGLISSQYKNIEGTPIEKYCRDRMADGGQLDGWIQSGGLWCTKKSILLKTLDNGKVFDEQFIGGGFEDVDLFLRLRDTYNMKIIMSGRSMFWHKEGATRWESDVQKYYKEMDNENSIKFEKKWGFNYWKKSVWKQIDVFNA